MQRILSFEQTPAFWIPLRFMLTAPLFALAAAILLFWEGPGMLASRWLPATLAFTHLLTIGFLSMTMVGALIQILQVVVGVDILWPRFTAAFTHSLLSAGTLLLAAGFLLSEQWLFRLAMISLGAGFAWLLAVCAIGLWRVDKSTATVTGIRLSLTGLAIAVALGLTAASAFAWPLPLPVIAITNVHAAWGLLAWVGLLTIGIAYQVVPMFQVTPVYPALMTRALAWVMMLALFLWSGAWLLAAPLSDWLAHLASLVLFLAFSGFAGVTLHLLRKRKRPADATTLFWRTSLASLLASAIVWQAGQWLPAIGEASWYPLVTGALFIIGFGCTVVNGMLYKIVPFLVWYHLQHQLSPVGRKAPNVRQVITDQAAGRQFQVHACALVLLAASPLWPQLLARSAALLFGISMAWLGWNLLQAARIYRRAAQDGRAGDLPEGVAA